jgi:predicted transcriptional regulator of viral defense system
MSTNVTRRSLGPRELSLIEAWEADRVRVVTLDAIQQALGEGTKRDAARKMASRLRQKGFLSPIRRGIYAVLPVSTLGVDAPDVAAHLEGLRLRGSEFYIGFDTAAGHYGWYPEASGRVTIGVKPLTHRALASVDGTYIRVVQSPPDVFADGVISDTWRGARLPIATREQAILDIIRRVDLVDGFSGCLAVLKAAGNDPNLDRTRLVGIAQKRRSVRSCKRLGWLGEKAGWVWNDEQLNLLRKDWPPTHRATLGDSHGGGQAGVWDNRWKLLINVPERELVPSVGVA